MSSSSSSTSSFQRGLTGLNNLGNTCYMNSLLQVLSFTDELSLLLDHGDYKSKLAVGRKPAECTLLVEYDELRKLMWSRNCIVQPVKFLHTVRNVAMHRKLFTFTGADQNDLNEFLVFIITCFHEALSREVSITIKGCAINDTDTLAVKCYDMVRSFYEKDYSEIWQLFFGVQVSTSTSSTSSTSSTIIPEPFFVLSLPIQIMAPPQRMVTLKDCFDLYTSEEIIDESSTKQKTLFWNFPPILVVDLKRFNASNKKNYALIDFPTEGLDLSEYVVGYNSASYIYDLYGVCNHHGTHTQGGHYTSFVKTGGIWYLFNDAQITRAENVVTNNAYCLFYRKRKM